MLLFIICEAPQKNSTFFKPFLAISTLFHLKKWPYLQKPELGNLGETRFWLLLVNNSLCSIPRSCARSYIKETPGDRCALGETQKKTVPCINLRSASLRSGALCTMQPAAGSCYSDHTAGCVTRVRTERNWCLDQWYSTPRHPVMCHNLSAISIIKWGHTLYFTFIISRAVYTVYCKV